MTALDPREADSENCDAAPGCAGQTSCIPPHVAGCHVQCEDQDDDGTRWPRELSDCDAHARSLTCGRLTSRSGTELAAQALMRALSFLVADDDERLREAMVTILRSLGGSVQQARDGRELLRQLARAIAAGEPPDLVVTDVIMPGASGLHVLVLARRLELEVPFLVVTGLRRSDLAEHVERQGRALLLPKPFTTGAFLALVRFLCGLDPTPGGNAAQA